MDHNEMDILLIDQFLLGELSNSEIIDFKQRIKDDTAFEEIYLERRAMQLNLRACAMDEKKKMLINLEAKLRHEEVKDSEKNIKSISSFRKRRRIIYTISVAAAIALIISIFNPWWTPNNPYQDVYTQNFEGYLSHVIKRGTTQDIDQLKSRAYALYEIQEYKKAAPLLEQIAESGDVSSWLYAGIANTGMGEFEKSQLLLRKYKNSTESLRDVANLYTAINQMMLGELEEAEKGFQELSGRNGFIGDKAKAFLAGMKK